MYNQSGLIGNINTDIFKMREFMIKDLMMKNNIDSNRYRTKFNKNSMLKEHKIQKIIKPVSPKNPLQRPIKTFLPIKTPTNNGTNSNYIQSSPSFIRRPTSNGSINKSTIDTANIKTTLDNGEKSYNAHKDYKNHYLDAKKRNNIKNVVRIGQQNEKFGMQLYRVNSPLNKDRLNNSYSKLKEYGNIAKRVEDKDDEFNKRKINYLKNFLPPLLTKIPSNSHINISKSDKMLALGKINNFRKFGAA